MAEKLDRDDRGEKRAEREESARDVGEGSEFCGWITCEEEAILVSFP